MNMLGSAPSAHADQFVRTLLPPSDLWPVFDFSAPHLAAVPPRLNAAEQLLDTAIAAGVGDKPAIFFDGKVWTYNHLHDRVERLAHLLVERYGLVPGNRVLLRSANTPMVAACWLAVLKAGGICVTTMPLLRADELAFILNRVQVRFAFCDLGLADELEAARTKAPSLERVGYFTPLGDGGHRNADLDHAVEAQPRRKSFVNIATAADDVALITFTSGTTGNPKAAAHFHRDIIAVSDCWPRIYTVEPGDVISGSPSLAFTYGLAAFLLYPLRYRASVAMVHRPTPDEILDTVQRHRVTSLYSVPTSFNTMLGEFERYDVKSLRKCSSAGENLRKPLWEAWKDATGIGIVNGIGATEMLTHFISESMAVERVGSTGRPVPGYTACVIDDDGTPLPPGSRGRLAIRGPSGCRYLDDIERQRIFVQNGWNVTGDVFEQDENGLFWFIDRADDMIVSSGYNISPQEVERTLLEHPEVAECAVVAVPDERRGNLVRACVVLAPGAAKSDETVKRLQDFAKSRIAPYKYPRQVRFYDDLPRTPTGKIQRYRLRQN